MSSPPPSFRLLEHAHPAPSSSCATGVPSVDASLAKWGLRDSMLLLRLGYSHRRYHPLARGELLRDVFREPAVAAAVNAHWAAAGAARPGDRPGPLLPAADGGALREVLHARVPCALTSTHAFDALARLHMVPECYEVEEERAYSAPGDGGEPVVRAGTGLIGKCFDVSVGGFLASDLLRVFAVQNLAYLARRADADGAGAGPGGVEDAGPLEPSLGERREFLFRLFCHLVVGGAVNQYEDAMEPYVRAAADLYRSLMRVQRRAPGAADRAAAAESSPRDERARVAAGGGADAEEAREAAMVEVVSDVYRVAGFAWGGDAGGELRRLGGSVQDFCYVIVDDARGRVCVLMNRNRPAF